MSFTSRVNEIRKHLNDNISGISSSQIAWDGIDNSDVDKNSPWIMVTVQPVTADQASIGNSTRKVRHVGLLVVQIFTKENETTKAANDLVESVASAVELQTTTGGVIFGATRPVRVGPKDGFYQINTFTEYKYDDIRS